MAADQFEFDVRCEWGAQGLAQLLPSSDVVIIVDVLSFSTAVEVATARGAVVFPYKTYDVSAREFAKSANLELAGTRRGGGRFSLSPESLREIPEGTRLVLPSPNGATLAMMTGDTPTLAGCLRNARAVARYARLLGRRIAVIPAGEQWSDNSLRPAVEDWLGAGAILDALGGYQSPEAEAAYMLFRAAQPQLEAMVSRAGSGKELVEQGFLRDVELACELNVSECVPFLASGAFTNRA